MYTKGDQSRVALVVGPKEFLKKWRLIFHIATIFYKNKCTQKETKRKNFEKTFIFFRTKNTTKM